MNFGGNSFLGLSVHERAIVCAQVSVGGGRRIVQRAATFELTGDYSLEKPEATGGALAAFLRHEKFSASRGVVGLPARWLIAIEKELPPAAVETANGMLRLQAERLAVSESGELVFDYAGKPGPGHASRVLLVGVLRKRLEQIERLFESAGISVQAVTSSSLALSKNAREEMPMLVLGRQGGEIVWRDEESPRMLRHVAGVAVNGHGIGNVGPLGAELGRTLMLARTNGAAREMLVWDGVGLSQPQVAELSQRSGYVVRSSDALKMLKLQAAPGALAEGGVETASAESFAPALSLALAAADRDALPLDFKRSRLAPRPSRRVGHLAIVGLVAGVLIVAALVAFYVKVEQRQSELNGIQANLESIKPSVDAAQAMSERVRYGRGFFDTRPPFLEALLEITKTVRPDSEIARRTGGAGGEEDLYMTSLTLRDEERRSDKGPPMRKGMLQGKAKDQATVQNMLDRLRKNPKFSEVKSIETRDAGGKSREVTFSASFNFIAME